MKRSVGQGLLDCHRRCFATGDFSAATQFYATPLGIYTPENGVFVYTNSRDFLKELTNRKSYHQNIGVTDIEGTISAQDLRQTNQFRLWVKWTYTMQDGAKVSGADIIYYCKMIAGQMQVQMVQILQETFAHERAASDSLAPLALKA